MRRGAYVTVWPHGRLSTAVWNRAAVRNRETAVSHPYYDRMARIVNAAGVDQAVSYRPVRMRSDDIRDGLDVPQHRDETVEAHAACVATWTEALCHVHDYWYVSCEWGGPRQWGTLTLNYVDMPQDAEVSNASAPGPLRAPSPTGMVRE